jgi:double-stranded uracil-DNA glycosylase
MDKSRSLTSTCATRPTRPTSPHGLQDRVRPPVRILFVGINPGLRSATLGHHFAGHSTRFWKLLHESGLAPRRVAFEDDVRLPDWGYGLTNLVARPTRGIDTLQRAEYLDGLRILRRKIRRWRPEAVALLGVTLYRLISPAKQPSPFPIGWQAETFEDARLAVLPNPSGRNAHYSYADMLACYRSLAG